MLNVIGIIGRVLRMVQIESVATLTIGGQILAVALGNGMKSFKNTISICLQNHNQISTGSVKSLEGYLCFEILVGQRS